MTKSSLTHEVQAIDPGEVDIETEFADPLLSELNGIVEANSPANPIGS